MSEYNHRKRREKNIMLFNLPEPTTASDHDNITNDLSNFSDIAVRRVFRVGKLVGDKPRPVKIVLDGPNGVLHVSKNNNKITWRQITFSPDLK